MSAEQHHHHHGLDDDSDSQVKMMTVMVINIIITKAACRIRMTIAVMNTANEDLASRGCCFVGAFACFTCSTVAAVGPDDDDR